MIRLNNYILNRNLTIFLPIQIVLVGWASRNPRWVEKYYTLLIYPEISGFLRRLFGWMPVSVGDILYGLLFISILGWVWYLYETRFSPFLEQLYRIGAFISVIFFIFHLFWGLNYHRVPLYTQLGYTNLQFDQSNLLQTTEKHIDKLNKIHTTLVSNDSTVVVVPYTRRKMYSMTASRFKTLTYKNVNLQLKHKSVKNSLYSLPLTYMGFSGYLNPITGESQVNKKIPKTTYPITTAHEMAHQLGYASETEANYIGYLLCVNHSDAYFQYSGEYMAVRFFINEIAKTDEVLAEKYFQKLHYGIRKNIEHNQDFWDSYKTYIKPISQAIYNKYLKANAQKEGMKSYNQMIAFLMQEE